VLICSVAFTPPPAAASRFKPVPHTYIHTYIE
jgi:hypothetical protein